MRFHEDHAAKWAPRPTFKSRPEDAGRVLHHNTLNAGVAPSRDEEERSREVERFFDMMTSSTPRTVERP